MDIEYWLGLQSRCVDLNDMLNWLARKTKLQKMVIAPTIDALIYFIQWVRNDSLWNQQV